MNRDTCGDKNTSHLHSFGRSSARNRELALPAMNPQPAQGKLFFDWAVAGLPPNLTSLETGRLPAGAVLGQIRDLLSARNRRNLLPRL